MDVEFGIHDNIKASLPRNLRNWQDAMHIKILYTFMEFQSLDVKISPAVLPSAIIIIHGKDKQFSTIFPGITAYDRTMY